MTGYFLVYDEHCQYIEDLPSSCRLDFKANILGVPVTQVWCVDTNIWYSQTCLPYEKINENMPDYVIDTSTFTISQVKEVFVAYMAGMYPLLSPLSTVTEEIRYFLNFAHGQSYISVQSGKWFLCSENDQSIVRLVVNGYKVEFYRIGEK